MRRARVARLAIAALLAAAAPVTAGAREVAGGAAARVVANAAQEAPAPAPWLVVISGVGGDDAHRVRFVELARRLIEAAVQEYGVPRAHVRYLAERVSLAPEIATARSTSAEIARVLAEVARAAGPRDDVWIVLFGHGSTSGERALFNVPGPDIAAEDFVPLLEPFGRRRVVFVDTTSSSGPFATALAAPGRIIVTATRSGAQRQEPRFAEHFVAAFTGGRADLDKDGSVSVLEAFLYANAEVARSYEDEGHLRLENALLEADGDGRPSPAPVAEEGDGALAAAVRLGQPAVVRAIGDEADPAVAALLRQRREVEAELEKLRARKDTLEEEEYLARLEDLLVRLAEIDAELRRHQEGQR